jgi:hypothetical protein
VSIAAGGFDSASVYLRGLKVDSNDKAGARSGKGTETMKLLKTLGNPMALVAQGFAIGAALFFATHPDSGRAVADIAFAHAPAASAGTLTL